MSLKEEFKKKVYRLTSQIPAGRVTTYGAIARALGKPQAARAVGRILNINPTPITVPCHRVVHSDGRIGGYGGKGGVYSKVRLLTAEGVVISNRRIEAFERVFYRNFKIID